jgi:2-C-methyl-D-erythritol 4-phosphate cytidylyltransferase
MQNKIIALVPAAGLGMRFGDALPKQYLDLNGFPMIYHALRALTAVTRISRVFVILAPGDRHWDSFNWSALSARIEVARCGGASRGESVLNGLRHIAASMDNADWVMVHDAARPCIRAGLIEQLVDELGDDPVGGLLAQPLADTLKAANENLRVARTVPRKGLWRAQTPQMFRFGMLRDALQQRPESTDESQAIEAMGHSPKLVAGDSANIKVTFAADLRLARMFLKGEKE